jgi:phosphoserine phosphatase
MLIEEHLVKQKMERDLALAREIQSRVLPRTVPQVCGYEIAGWSESADETGGDIYDVIKIDPHGLCLLMGDATGHGIGPALSVTQVRSMVRMAMRLGAGLDELFSHVNDQLSDDLPSNRFVTAFLGFLDAARHELHYHAGGQGPILHYHAIDRECEWIDASTFPMGIMSGVPVDRPKPMELEVGDIVGLISDGIFEYADPDSKQFGEKRVGDVLAEHGGGAMTDLIDHLRNAVETFARGAPQNDDMTIVFVKRVE